ncbi:hypothetical protein GGS21DRAFT_314048 [Xylaria nigripes]|nr:hypothetical protein GGS21DRAFT_314048 [Xylaria nigripes]
MVALSSLCILLLFIIPRFVQRNKKRINTHKLSLTIIQYLQQAGRWDELVQHANQEQMQVLLFSMLSSESGLAFSPRRSSSQQRRP